MENFSKLNLNRQPHEISKPKFFSPIPPPAKFKMHQRYTYTHTHQRHMQKNHLIYKIYNFHTFFSKFDFSWIKFFWQISEDIHQWGKIVGNVPCYQPVTTISKQDQIRSKINLIRTLIPVLLTPHRRSWLSPGSRRPCCPGSNPGCPPYFSEILNPKKNTSSSILTIFLHWRGYQYFYFWYQCQLSGFWFRKYHFFKKKLGVRCYPSSG